MATATPTRTRAEAISELWNEDKRLLSAAGDLSDGVGNASSEIVGHLLEIDDARPSEDAWIERVADEVQEAGMFAARRAMIEKFAELVDEAPESLLAQPGSSVLRELRELPHQ